MQDCQERWSSDSPDCLLAAVIVEPKRKTSTSEATVFRVILNREGGTHRINDDLVKRSNLRPLCGGVNDPWSLGAPKGIMNQL